MVETVPAEGQTYLLQRKPERESGATHFRQIRDFDENEFVFGFGSCRERGGVTGKVKVTAQIERKIYFPLERGEARLRKKEA